VHFLCIRNSGINKYEIKICCVNTTIIFCFVTILFLFLCFALSGNKIQVTWLREHVAYAALKIYFAYLCHVNCNVLCKNFQQNSARLKLNQTRAQKANKRLFAQTRNFELREKQWKRADFLLLKKQTLPSFSAPFLENSVQTRWDGRKRRRVVSGRGENYSWGRIRK
jgi:hypothetical protein